MKKIISIDGGGIRGLIPALVLAEIESRTGRAVAECFDLIAGTSTGGILAMGLARDNGNGKPRYTAGDLADIYQNRGKEIFSRSLRKGAASLGGLADETEFFLLSLGTEKLILHLGHMVWLNECGFWYTPASIMMTRCPRRFSRPWISRMRISTWESGTVPMPSRWERP